MCDNGNEGQFYLSTLSNGWTVGRFRALDALGVVHAVTTKDGMDVMAVRNQQGVTNRLIAEAMNFRAAGWCHQVHGRTVLVVDGDGQTADADGLVTALPGVGVWGRSADCPLILAADSEGKSVGMAHASWRGTVQRIAEVLIARMVEQGSRADRIVACICPSAGACCYEVGPDVLAAAVQGIGAGVERFFRPVAEGKYMLDLWAANTDQLTRSGVRAENVHLAGICTMCRTDLFPSHRREADKAGRFAAIIGKTQG